MFDQLVSLPVSPADAFQLRRQSDNALVGLSASVSNGATTVVTLTFNGALSEFGSLADGRYTLTVSASAVASAFGNLDGNQDSVGGDDFTLTSATAPTPPTNIFRFFGDSDGDGDVDAVNVLAFRDAYLGLVPYNPAFDFDNSGSVDAADFLQFRSRYLLGSI
jgi:hypothetical protein